MLDFNMVNAIIVVALIVIFIVYVAPYLKKKNIDYYTEVKTALLLFGYAFRDDKVKAIAQTAYMVVNEMEQLSLTNAEKQREAVEKAFDKLATEFNIVLDEQVLSLIIDIAVTLLPKTNK